MYYGARRGLAFMTAVTDASFWTENRLCAQVGWLKIIHLISYPPVLTQKCSGGEGRGETWGTNRDTGGAREDNGAIYVPSLKPGESFLLLFPRKATDCTKNRAKETSGSKKRLWGLVTTTLCLEL